MRRFALFAVSIFVILVTFSTPPAFSQTPSSGQSLTRDPQALALLQASAAAMGKTLPSDSVATGNVTLVAGSSTDEGSIRILTKGTSQTAVEVQTASGTSWSIVASNGQANNVDGTKVTALSLEQASTTQSAYFPLPVISEILGNQDSCYQYIGPETLNGTSVQHVRVWNSFNSTSYLQFLSGFTTTDIWLDAVSGLPLQVSFIRRRGGGSAPKIPITIAYLNYQNVGGVLYPYQIEESVNGTLWAAVTIQSVVFNSGLSDANFPITTGAN
jgi:hypothetical protein